MGLNMVYKCGVCKMFRRWINIMPETEASLLHYGADKRCEKVAMVTLGYSGQVAINGERLIASATQQCDSLV